MERVAELQQRLLGAGGQQHLNEIAELFELCESADLRVVVAALSAISQVLAAHRVAASDALQKWLRQHGAALRGLLNQLGSSGEAKAQIAALRLTVKILQEEAREMHKTPAPEESARVWGCLSPDQRLQELISAILLSPRWHSQVADCIMSEYVRRYADLRHFLMGHLRSCAEQMGKLQLPQKPEVEGKRRRLHGPFAEAAYQQGRSHEELFERMLALLKEAPEPPGKEDEELQDVLLDTAKPVSFYCKAYKHIFQEAWLKLLGLRVPLAHCAGLLQLLPSQVIPHLGRPLLVSDFYLRAFNAGSLELSVQALSGLLLLLTRYGLGDPETLSSSCGDFYAQLYSLLRPATFRLKKRARFQRLVAAALTSNLLPATSAAAFAKKCLRCAVLLSEPGTVMWLLSVAYGLIQRNHSRCSFLLHRAGDAVAKDPFDSEASLPEATAQVAQTSLWEIQLLFQHHLPAVQTLAKLFERPFFKPTSRKLDPELFLDQTMVKSYQQALKSAERQLSKLKARGAKPPLAFRSQEDEVARRVAGWAAALSTGQRRVGADL